MYRVWFWFVVMAWAYASSRAFAGTEIQMFLHYQGPNRYEQKIVSTPQNPVSAFYVYAGDGSEPLAAACYGGKPRNALHLFQTMVAVYNAEYSRHLSVEGFPFFNFASGDVDLRIFGVDEQNRRFLWFDHMNPCVRPSRALERWPQF